MAGYFTTPFPFQGILKRAPNLSKVDLEDSIRAHIRSLILMRLGEFAYDKSLGFEMWDFDKEVFYHDEQPYYENQQTKRGLMENAHARKHFQENLKTLLEHNELRMQIISVMFGFEKVDGNLSVYQRKIVIEVEGKIRSTGKRLSPSFKMSILYTPFEIKSN